MEVIHKKENKHLSMIDGRIFKHDDLLELFFVDFCKWLYTYCLKGLKSVKVAFEIMIQKLKQFDLVLEDLR